MPATARGTRKSRGAVSLENGTREGVGKENSAPTGVTLQATKKRSATEDGGRKTKRKKAGAMINDDGFEFRPRKSKRLSEKITPLIEPEKGKQKTEQEPEPEKEKARSRGTKRLPPASPEEPPVPRPPPAAKSKKPSKRKTETSDRPRLKSPDNSVLSSGSTSKISLPTSDTPIIRKNQNYRKAADAGGRRSSVGQRGRRASSLLLEGIVAEPHAEIAHEDFYKHIDEEQLEHMRMRQLLSWCAHRALHQPCSSAQPAAASESARNLARVIKEEILKEITSNGQLSTWMTRAQDDPTAAASVATKPNPQNERNQEKMADLKAQLATLEEERKAWRALKQSRPHEPISIPRDFALTNDNKNLLLGAEVVAQADALITNSNDLIGQARKTVKAQQADIEFQMDRLADGVHRLLEYGDAADRLAGRVLEDAEHILGDREARLKQASGTEALPLQEVLRSLSRVDCAL